MINEDGSIDVIEQGKEDGEPYPELTLRQVPLEGTDGEKLQVVVTATVKQTNKTKKIVTVENLTTKEEKEYVEGGVIFVVPSYGSYTFKATTNMNKSKMQKLMLKDIDGEINMT